MSWSKTQRDRLAIEKDLIEKHFRHVTWNNPTSSSGNVEVQMESNSNKSYKLRVYFSPDFPNACPEMVMVFPSNLTCKNGSSLPIYSATFHTLGQRDGYTRLCHFIPSLWTADNTLYQVFMKGRLWLEAYEGHLATGNDMDVYLPHQSRVNEQRQDDVNERRQDDVNERRQDDVNERRQDDGNSERHRSCVVS